MQNNAKLNGAMQPEHPKKLESESGLESCSKDPCIYENHHGGDYDNADDDMFSAVEHVPTWSNCSNNQPKVAHSLLAK